MRVTSVRTYARAFSGPDNIHFNVSNYRNSNWAIAGKTAAFVCGIIPGLVVVALEQILIVGPKQREVARNSKLIFDALLNRNLDQDSVTVTLLDQGINREITLTQRREGTNNTVTFSEVGEEPCVTENSFEDILTKIRTDWENNPALYPELVMSGEGVYDCLDKGFRESADITLDDAPFVKSLRNLLFFVPMPKTKSELMKTLHDALALSLLRHGKFADEQYGRNRRFWTLFDKIVRDSELDGTAEGFLDLR